MAQIVVPSCAVVVGATGGIGRALTAALAEGGAFARIHALSRSGEQVRPDVVAGRIDLTDEGSIRDCAAEIAAGSLPVGLAIVATGFLHQTSSGAGGAVSPEKSWRQLDADALLRSFQLNAIGPALVAKHLLPLLPRQGRAVFAALSARVGSIGDNRLGGWYGYRASKAALNQLIRTLAIELSRSRPDAICLGLHPGTVDTDLSRPFQSGVAEERLFSPELAASRLLAVIDGADSADSGRILAWDGQVVPP